MYSLIIENQIEIRM